MNKIIEKGRPKYLSKKMKTWNKKSVIRFKCNNEARERERVSKSRERKSIQIMQERKEKLVAYA